MLVLQTNIATNVDLDPLLKAFRPALILADPHLYLQTSLHLQIWLSNVCSLCTDVPHPQKQSGEETVSYPDFSWGRGDVWTQVTMCGISDLGSDLVLGSDTLTLVAWSALFFIFLFRGLAGNFPRVRGLKI